MHIVHINLFIIVTLILTVLTAGLFTGVWRKASLKLRHAGSTLLPSKPIPYDGDIHLNETTAALQNNSIRDELTGLYNRRHFSAAFQMEWTRAARDGHHLAILMIDIDDFQHLTAANGQLYSDRLVRQVGHCIGKCTLRNEHQVAHIGPGKFALILPGANLNDSREIADSIRANIPRIPRTDSRAAGPLVAVSIGGTCCIPQYRSSPAKMLHEADLALNQARMHRANQVWLAPADEDVTLHQLAGVPA